MSFAARWQTASCRPLAGLAGKFLAGTWWLAGCRWRVSEGSTQAVRTVPKQVGGGTFGQAGDTEEELACKAGWWVCC